MKKILIFLLGLSFSSLLLAQSNSKSQLTSGVNDHWLSTRLSVGVYGGIGHIDGAYKQDGQSAQTRIALGLRTANYKAITVGLEAGLQSGNIMRLAASSELINATGGLPIQSTLKPVIDLLLTAKGPLSSNQPLYGVLKGGLAYRQLTLESRSSTRDGLIKLNGELQAGIAYQFNSHAAISAFYQGIFSGSQAGLAMNTAGDIIMKRIPAQHAGFIGIEYSI